MSDPHKNYQSKLYSKESWPDFLALFGKHKGVRGGCWCTSNRCSSTQYEKMGRDGRQAFQKNLVESGQGHGLLVFDEEVPIAWCQFGPADAFPRFDNGRLYSKLEIPPEWQPVWRISCLFVDKHRRKKGWANIALKETVQEIGRQGGGVVEAFPFELPGRSPSYTGTVNMYRKHGFEKVVEVGKDRWLMRGRISS